VVTAVIGCATTVSFSVKGEIREKKKGDNGYSANSNFLSSYIKETPRDYVE
jgi:hypothetical protein